MKLALVYNPFDNKLLPSSYCSVFRGMFVALAARFEETQHIHESCSAADIDADVIFFFDPHSSHHITIDGLSAHRAVKMEYWNDPHQQEVHGIYKSTGYVVHKLGRKQRVERARERGIDYIVSPVRDAFYEYFGQIMPTQDMDRMLLYFPTAPSFDSGKALLSCRLHTVLANGATWGDHENNGYAFRRWAYKQPYVDFVPHATKKNGAPQGEDYGAFLSHYAGALALCDAFPVAKFFEIPLAQCVTFAQYHQEYEDLGFRDLVNCIYVDRSNLEQRVRDFLNDIPAYQKIADAGQKLMLENYTAGHFAEFLHSKIQNTLGVKEVA